jgi:hypothetical protein
VWFYEEHASRIFTELQAKEAAWRAANNRRVVRMNRHRVEQWPKPPRGWSQFSGRPRRDRAARRARDVVEMEFGCELRRATPWRDRPSTPAMRGVLSPAVGGSARSARRAPTSGGGQHPRDKFMPKGI